MACLKHLYRLGIRCVRCHTNILCVIDVGGKNNRWPFQVSGQLSDTDIQSIIGVASGNLGA